MTREYVAGDLVIRHGKHRVEFGGAPIEFTNKEYKFLFSIVSRSYTKRVVAIRDIYDDVYDAYQPDSNSFNVHLSRVRKKIKNAGSSVRILTQRGVGYELQMADGSALTVMVK